MKGRVAVKGSTQARRSNAEKGGSVTEKICHLFISAGFCRAPGRIRPAIPAPFPLFFHLLIFLSQILIFIFIFLFKIYFGGNKIREKLPGASCRIKIYFSF